jgi:hypothetical protein
MALVVLLAAIAGSMPVATHGRTWGRFSRVPRLVLLVVGLIGITGALIDLAFRAVPAGQSAAFDRGLVALIRTAALAVAAVGLAWGGRWRRFVEARWLVYPVLVAGGLKLVAEDLRTGRPATLFASLALFGLALILAPRLLRHDD